MPSASRTYPCKVLSLKNLKNEKWRDIPGLEDYYCISQFGRVKRLAFEISCANGQQRSIKTKILKPGLSQRKNLTVRDHTAFLRIKIMRSGEIFDISIPRLVYHCFIHPFDRSDYSLVVLCKDGNGVNIRPANLILASLSDKQSRMFDRKRHKKHILYSYDEFIKHGLESSATSYCKQITQYDLNGKKIQTYPSIYAAARTLNISPAGINSTLKERQLSCGGFLWQYGHTARMDMRAFEEKKKRRRKTRAGVVLTQYHPKGRRIATYLTVSAAQQATGIGGSELSAALNGRQRSAGGFIWKKGRGKPKIDTHGYSVGEKWRAQRRQKEVEQHTPNGRYIRKFPSVKEAARHHGITPSAISTALDRPDRLARGFSWKSTGLKTV
jgi:hypothetical protein